jgi:hypothetical protein
MRPDRRRRGAALAIVIIFCTMVLASWALASRRMVAQLRLKGYLVRREVDGEEGARRRQALALGLALLETGTPPVAAGETAYQCTTDIVDRDGTVRTYHLQFDKVTVLRWAVRARLSKAGDPPNLPSPSRFPAPDPDPPSDP